MDYFVRFLIGRNGSNIRKIRELTGARIVFPSDSEANNTKERDVITIVGREDAVKKAREELEIRIKELVSEFSALIHAAFLHNILICVFSAIYYSIS